MPPNTSIRENILRRASGNHRPPHHCCGEVLLIGKGSGYELEAYVSRMHMEKGRTLPAQPDASHAPFKPKMRSVIRAE